MWCGGGRNAVATVTVAGNDVRVTEGETETKEELKPREMDLLESQKEDLPRLKRSQSD